MTPDLDALFASYITKSILAEGGERYTNDPADRGGETKWGITVARARAAGYSGPMQAMTREQALPIYKLYYWQQPGFDAIAAMVPPLGAELLDLGINGGPDTPSRELQRVLNVLSEQGADYSHVQVDGHCGAMTRASLAGLIRRRGAEGVRVLMLAIRGLAAARYIELAENDATQERFEFGWLSQRAFPAQ